MEPYYKIEFFFKDDQKEFFWCIIKITSSYTCNIGHGISNSYNDAVQEAYGYFQKNLV